MGLPKATEKKTNELRDDSCSDPLSRTMVIEKPQRLRTRPRGFLSPWFSISVLECAFSNQPLGYEFQGKMPRIGDLD